MFSKGRNKAPHDFAECWMFKDERMVFQADIWESTWELNLLFSLGMFWLEY